MLKLVDVCTYYGTIQVLYDVSLEVKQGSAVAVLGRNGMGKTTTVHSIVSFTPPRSGAVCFKGETITSLRPYQIAQMGLALVPQGRRIFTSLSVEENLIMGARREEKKAYSLEMIYSLFPILKVRKQLKASSLSGGEQQILSIGRALMTNPDMLLMDEPTEGLAPVIIQELGGIIDKLKGAGISILLVEQNAAAALAISNYAAVMENGRIVLDGTPEKLISHEDVREFYLGILGEEEKGYRDVKQYTRTRRWWG